MYNSMTTQLSIINIFKMLRMHARNFVIQFIMDLYRVVLGLQITCLSSGSLVLGPSKRICQNNLGLTTFKK